MEFGIVISFGKSAGFQLKLRGKTKRICLWKIAITYIPVDGDFVIQGYNHFLGAQQFGREFGKLLNDIEEEAKDGGLE